MENLTHAALQRPFIIPYGICQIWSKVGLDLSWKDSSRMNWRPNEIQFDKAMDVFCFKSTRWVDYLMGMTWHFIGVLWAYLPIGFP